MRWAGRMLLVSLLAVGLGTTTAQGAARGQSDAGVPVWSSPTTIDRIAPMDSGLQLNGVSCPSLHLCLAVDDHGQVLSTREPLTAARWRAVAVASVRLTATSCPTTSLCLVLGPDRALFASTNPSGPSGAWRAIRVPGTSPILGIACASPHLCVVVVQTGAAFITENPTAARVIWHRQRVAPRLKPHQGVYLHASVSCPTAHFCAAVMEGDDVVFTTRRPQKSSGRWHEQRLVGQPELRSISCSSTHLCVTIDGAGDIYSSTAPSGGRWHLNRHAAFGAGTVSCNAAGLCIAPRPRSYYISTHPARAGHAWRRLSLPRTGTRAVACPSDKLCVAVTWNGWALSTSDVLKASWQSNLIDGDNGLTGVSCPAAGFCVAIDSAGDILSSTDPSGGAAAWSGFRVARRHVILGSISCPTSALCVVTGFGGILTSTDPGGGSDAWHWSEIDSGHGLLSVSCPSSDLCVAIDEQGAVFTSTEPAGGAPAWSATAIDGSLQTVACASVSLCLIGEEGARVLSSTDPTGGAGAWHQAALPNPNSPDVLGASCPSTQLCVVMDRGGLFTSTDPAGAAPNWSSEGDPFGEAELGGVECPSANLCIAFAGRFGASDGELLSSTAPTSQTWTVTARDPAAAVTGVSCQPGTTTCVAVDDTGRALTSH